MIKGPAYSHLVVKAQAPTLPNNCQIGMQESGSVYMICMPDEDDWNGDVLLYAHGYVPITEPVGIPWSQMYLPGPFGPIAVNDLVTALGYGFGTTSYPTNGLAVLPGIVDLVDLVDVFAEKVTTPNRVLLAGVSEGGLITTLAVEWHPDVFDGGMALCGPYGGFHEQVDHIGDFRIVFDYFFPGLMPGEPITIPAWLMDDWSTSYFAETILPVIEDPTNELSVTQLLAITGAAPYAFDPPTSTEAIEKLLWYNVYATEDAKLKLGGQPYSNTTRIYSGSSNDADMNDRVARIAADQAAIDEIEALYQTTGHLSRPLVTLHTTGDFVVPYWHAPLYQEKVTRAGRDAYYQHFVTDVHGHCTFDAVDVLLTFQALERMLPAPVFLPLVMQAAPSD
jgi:pimeloyl-ACP methyl ester carboxylesterase